MNYYVDQLEKSIINNLLPAYLELCKLKNEKADLSMLPLNITKKFSSKKPLPKLLQKN